MKKKKNTNHQIPPLPPFRIEEGVALGSNECLAGVQKKHQHSFVIERGVMDAKKKHEIKYLDLYCKCGMALFVEPLGWHRGDEDERPLTDKDL